MDIPDVMSTFENRLRVLNLVSDLDGAIIYCGTGVAPRQAHFVLRIYSKLEVYKLLLNVIIKFTYIYIGAPNLVDNFLVLIEENSLNVPIDLHQEQVAFPEPSVFSWNKDGQPLRTDQYLLTYSNITFNVVRIYDAGNYTVSAINFVLGGTVEQVGNDTGSFYLDVLCKLLIVMQHKIIEVYFCHSRWTIFPI